MEPLELKLKNEILNILWESSATYGIAWSALKKALMELEESGDTHLRTSCMEDIPRKDPFRPI